MVVAPKIGLNLEIPPSRNPSPPSPKLSPRYPHIRFGNPLYLCHPSPIHEMLKLGLPILVEDLSLNSIPPLQCLSYGSFNHFPLTTLPANAVVYQEALLLPSLYPLLPSLRN